MLPGMSRPLMRPWRRRKNVFESGHTRDPEIRTKSAWVMALILVLGVMCPTKVLAVEISDEEVRKPGQLIQPLTVFSEVLDAKKVRRLTQIVVESLKAYKQFTIAPPPETDMLELFMEHDCVEPDAECLAKIGLANQANVTLFFLVDRVDRRFVLEYKLVRNVDGLILRSGETRTNRSRALIREVKRAIRKIYGDPSTVKLKPALLVVETNVADANVFLDDEALGTAPVRVEVKPGQHILRVEKEGYEVYRKTIFVHRVRGYHGLANLKPLQVVVTETGETVVSSDIPEEIEKEPTEIYQQWWFWTGAAVIVSGTVATIVALTSSGSPATGGTIFTLDPTQVENDAVFSLP